MLPNAGHSCALLLAVFALLYAVFALDWRCLHVAAWKPALQYACTSLAYVLLFFAKVLDLHEIGFDAHCERRQSPEVVSISRKQSVCSLIPCVVWTTRPNWHGWAVPIVLCH